MYHHHHTSRSTTSQYNAIPSSRTSTTHAFTLCNCPFSLSALSILFSPVPGDVGAWVTLWLVECFRILVQSGYPCPTFPPVPTVFRIDRNPFFFSPLPSPSNTLLILVIPIIRSHSILLLVRHTISPSASRTRSNYYLPLSPTPSRLFDHLPFLISRHNTCLYFLIFYSFNSIVLLFYSSHTPKSSVVRTSLLQPNLSLASTILVLPVTLSPCCLSGIQESVQCVCVSMDSLVLRYFACGTLNTHLTVPSQVLRLLLSRQGLPILQNRQPWTRVAI